MKTWCKTTIAQQQGCFDLIFHPMMHQKSEMFAIAAK
jgi:hypothetical protein